MIYYYIMKDGANIGRAATRENAIALIREYQKAETWYLKAQFSIIAGKEEFIDYEKPKRKKVVKK